MGDKARHPLHPSIFSPSASRADSASDPPRGSPSSTMRRPSVVDAKRETWEHRSGHPRAVRAAASAGPGVEAAREGAKAAGSASVGGLARALAWRATRVLLS